MYIESTIFDRLDRSQTLLLSLSLLVPKNVAIGNKTDVAVNDITLPLTFLANIRATHGRPYTPFIVPRSDKRTCFHYCAISKE
jgi:hypothetical protein